MRRHRLRVRLRPDVVEVRPFLVPDNRQQFGPEEVVVPQEDDSPDPVSRSLLEPDRFHDPAPVVPGVVDPQDFHPGVPGLLVQTDDRVHVVVPLLVAVFPGVRDPMEHSAVPRHHLPAKSLLAQPLIPGKADVLDVAPFPFHDQYGERSPARGRLLDGDGDVGQQVVSLPIKRDQPFPKITHQSALGDLLVSPESGGFLEAGRLKSDGALPAHVVLRPLLDLDDRAEEIGSRLAPRDRFAHVNGEEPRPLVLAPHAGESLFPAAEIVRLSRFRTEKPRHLFGREPSRPRKPEIPHGPGLSLDNRHLDLPTAVFHVACHGSGGHPPDESLPRQECPYGLLRVGKVLLLDGRAAPQSGCRDDLRRGEPLRPRHFDLRDQGERPEEEEEIHLPVRLARERGDLAEDRFLGQPPNRRADPLPGEPIPGAHLDEPREFFVGDQERGRHLERDRGDEGTGGCRRGGFGRRGRPAKEEEERRRQEEWEEPTPFHEGSPSTVDTGNGT